tara:strand:+ start:880 stop:1719 length:840 start_codon:yes stop_codon:yes gene_type:complete
MGNNKLIQHYNNQIASFYEHFHNTKERQDVEDIHQLRVYTKRIKTNLTLMEIISNDEFSKKEHYNLFSRLFRKAGKLRENQIHLDLIENYDSHQLTPYEEHLLQTKINEMENVQMELNAFDFSKLNNLDNSLLEKVSHISDETVAEQSIAFLLKKLNRVEKLKSKINNEHKLHKIRIHLQAVREILRLMVTIQSAEIIYQFQNDSKALTDMIGKWHDYSVLIFSLKQFTDENILQNLNQVTGQIEAEYEFIRKSIGHSLDNYPDPAKLEVIEQWPSFNA